MSVQPDGPGDDGVVVLRASGDLDIATVPDLLSDAAALVEGARGVLLDLTDVTFMDSSGTRFIDRLTRECGDAGIELRVVAPPGTQCRRVLEIIGLAELLVVDDLDEGRALVR
jgi:stage II sporulation protein AA (anti-sigma F factor antagonist)